MASVTLLCVSEGSKLRVKFLDYIDESGKHHHNVYNNRLNCQFPKNIRQVGRKYTIPATDISLAQTGKFYRVKKANIVITDENIQLNTVIFKNADCVICLDMVPNILYNCGHVCVCSSCDGQLKSRVCPLCRANITNMWVS
jgi:hypothetical protein